MTTAHSQTLTKKHYSTPELVVKGGIEALTQVNKTLGLGDGFILVDIPGIPNNSPIRNAS